MNTQPLIEWLMDRRDNCARIMDTKPESEKAGWLEDAAYFEAAILALSERYFIGGDNSGHEYYVPVSREDEFREWAELPEEDERGWDAPEWATRIDGTFTFVNPRCE